MLARSRRAATCAAVVSIAALLSLAAYGESYECKDAIGCLTGGAAGAVAGHYAGHHAVLGAVGGCIAGHHLHKEQEKKRLEEKKQLEEKKPAPDAPKT